MKKLFSLLLTAIMIISLCACRIDNGTQKSDKLSIVATIFPQYDFSRQLAKNKAEVSMLLSPGTESHSFEPTTSDILAINNCDIFIYTGGDSDHWIDSLLENVDNPDLTVISLMDCVDTHHSNHEDDEAHHSHNHSHIDEHVWTSPINAISITEKICEEMCKKDDENADYYKNNYKEYKDELLNLHENFRNIAETAEKGTLVFADRFPLRYFEEEYSLSHYAAFTGCSDDTEPSAHTVKELIDIVRKENFSTILKIELSSDSIAKTISEETGAEIRTFYSCHNISKEDFEKGETYLSLMQKNLETLSIALN
ncbi:MAG: zinc ABC transporter substrate-binding protein [Ruminococcus sp.]|nr:zinc ABC transporter substrate-binding protein [Ruminococcus sp.]